MAVKSKEKWKGYWQITLPRKLKTIQWKANHDWTLLSIIGVLLADVITEQNNISDEKVKIKYFKEVCRHDKIIVALNADKDKYLNYEKSTNSDTIGNKCELYHNGEKLNFFGLP